MTKPLYEKSRRLETTEELEHALRNYEGPIVVHKFNGRVYLFRIIDVEGLYLFNKLHQGHDDIITEMVAYGEYLLAQRLERERKKKPTALALVPVNKK